MLLYSQYLGIEGVVVSRLLAPVCTKIVFGTLLGLRMLGPYTKDGHRILHVYIYIYIYIYIYKYKSRSSSSSAPLRKELSNCPAPTLA